MKTKIFILLAAIALIFRFLQVLPYPQGGGRSQESPDKQFWANASTLKNCSFFGGERSYYEFTISSATHRRVRRMVIEGPLEGVIEWRDEGTIVWAADSSSVTYSFRGTQLILRNAL